MADLPVTVRIPASLRRNTGGVAEVTVAANTVRDAVSRLEELFPGILARLCDGERLRTGLAVAINSRVGTASLSTPVPPGAEINFVQTVAGG